MSKIKSAELKKTKKQKKMKTILLILTTLFVFNLSSKNKQITKFKIKFPIKDSSNYTIYIGNQTSKSINKLSNNEVPYIIGSLLIPGYEIEVRSCKKDKNLILENGVFIAGISCILIDKFDYIGGNLIYGNYITIIKDILVEPLGKNGAKFIVIGENFNMNFKLTNGVILKLENNYSIFNTLNKEIWSIEKKI